MKPVFFTIFFSLGLSFLFGQNLSNEYFWIKFKDKNNCGYSFTNPTQFLSQKSIDRRTNQGIALDSTDLPITQSYIDSVLPYTTQLINKLKWFNMIVVQILDSANLDSIKRFPFVDSIATVLINPYKSLTSVNKFESGTPINQQIIYPDVHGAAYHQLNMLNGDLLHQLGYRGNGIIIAMMDNGCVGADSIDAFDSVRPRIYDTWDFTTNQPSIYNDPIGTHGTSTLGCIAANIPYRYVGSAPDAGFVLFHTQSNYWEEVIEEYYWAAAAERADSDGAQIFTTSLGYNLFDGDTGNITYAELNGNTTMITQAGNIAATKGILVFNSQGNDGCDSWHYLIAPADGDSIIAVGAVDSARTIWNCSAFGPNSSGKIKPDLCAQGADVNAIWPQSNTTYNIEVLDGTSFSSPTLAGCAACLWQAFPNKTALQIKEAIMKSADRYTNPNDTFGYGIPNFYNAYLFLQTNYNGNILRITDDAAVYPNPFTDQLNVSLYNDTAGYRTIELFDLLGQRILSQQVFVRPNTFQIVTFNRLNNLATGQYFLRLDDDKEFSHTVIKAP